MIKMKKSLSLERMTDICAGRMTVEEINREINHYMICKTPSKMVITIERNKKIGGFYSAIYIPIKDFEKQYK